MSFQGRYESILKIFGEILDAFTKKRISVKQLKYLSKIEENSGLLYYQLVDKLSVEQQIPKSTVRWNLNKLRDAGMIIAGDKNSKGVPVKLTEKGRITLLAIKAGQKNLSKNFCSKSLFNGEWYLKKLVFNMSGQKRRGESLKNERRRTENPEKAEEEFELSFWYETRPEGP